MHSSHACDHITVKLYASFLLFQSIRPRLDFKRSKLDIFKKRYIITHYNALYSYYKLKSNYLLQVRLWAVVTPLPD